jgi:NAD(P)-dependent dehydrogenase (short-subunit alcohol dehydrogenase family)
MNLLITGNSSGLGLGFSQEALKQGWRVYGCSRRGCELEGVQDILCDLQDFTAIPKALASLLEGVDRLDLVILNAGILGEIKPMQAQSLDELRQLMDVNLWSNKVILDWLLNTALPVKQVIAISSGAAVLANKGWGGYTLSKAALNMLMRLYAHEFPQTHLCALAPGIIDTPMMDYLCEEPDPKDYPALQRLRNARGTTAMPSPPEAAQRIFSVLAQLREFKSGSFVDIRQLLDPEGYAALMSAVQ